MAKRKRMMTKAEALAKLKETRSLSTDMLKPLGIGMESFLRLAQMSDEQQAAITEKLIAKVEHALACE